MDHTREKTVAVEDTRELLKKVFLTEAETSILSRRAISTLRNQRFLRKGFPYTKCGKSVRYRVSDILAAMEAGRISFDDAPGVLEGERHKSNL